MTDKNLASELRCAIRVRHTLDFKDMVQDVQYVINKFSHWLYVEMMFWIYWIKWNIVLQLF